MASDQISTLPVDSTAESTDSLLTSEGKRLSVSTLKNYMDTNITKNTNVSSIAPTFVRNFTLKGEKSNAGIKSVGLVEENGAFKVEVTNNNAVISIEEALDKTPKYQYAFTADEVINHNSSFNQNSDNAFTVQVGLNKYATVLRGISKVSKTISFTKNSTEGLNNLISGESTITLSQSEFDTKVLNNYHNSYCILIYEYKDDAWTTESKTWYTPKTITKKSQLFSTNYAIPSSFTLRGISFTDDKLFVSLYSASGNLLENGVSQSSFANKSSLNLLADLTQRTSAPSIIDVEVDDTNYYELDTANSQIGVYLKSSQTYISASAIALASGNSNPTSMKKIGNKIYVADNVADTVFVYNITTKAEITAEAISLQTSSAKIYAIEVSSTYLYINRLGSNIAQAYLLSTGAYTAVENFTLDLSNSSSYGMYLGVAHLFVFDSSLNQILAYNIATGVRESYAEISGVNFSSYGFCVYSDPILKNEIVYTNNYSTFSAYSRDRFKSSFYNASRTNNSEQDYYYILYSCIDISTPVPKQLIFENSVGDIEIGNVSYPERFFGDTQSNFKTNSIYNVSFCKVSTELSCVLLSNYGQSLDSEIVNTSNNYKLDANLGVINYSASNANFSSDQTLQTILSITSTKIKHLLNFSSSYNSNNYIVSYQALYNAISVFGRLYFLNSDLSDFLRTYNSSSGEYDSTNVLQNNYLNTTSYYNLKTQVLDNGDYKTFGNLSLKSGSTNILLNSSDTYITKKPKLGLTTLLSKNLNISGYSEQVLDLSDILNSRISDICEDFNDKVPLILDSTTGGNQTFVLSNLQKSSTKINTSVAAIGIISGIHSDGANVPVQFFKGSSVLTGFTNLVPLVDYYLQSNGDISKYSQTGSILLGQAISGTEILLN